MHAELVAEAAARVDLERVLAREEPHGDRVRREVRARDGEHVRAGDDVVDERRLVEHRVDDGLRALRVVDREDRREEALERIHLDGLHREVVHALDPRTGEARERALDVVADGRGAGSP